MAAEPQWKCKTQTESRRPVFASALVIIAGQAWVAHSLHLSPLWLFPLISTVLLVASVAVYEGRAIPGVVARILSHALSTVLIIANAVSLVLLVRGVFLGSPLKPTSLLFAGLALWLANVAVFALLYWELDGGGPEARADGYRGRYPDLVFPQQQPDQQGLARLRGSRASTTTSTCRSQVPRPSLPPTRCRTRSGRSSPWALRTCFQSQPWP